MAVSAISVLRNIDFPPRETLRWTEKYQTDLTRAHYKRITNEPVSDN